MANEDKCTHDEQLSVRVGNYDSLKLENGAKSRRWYLLPMAVNILFISRREHDGQDLRGQTVLTTTYSTHYHPRMSKAPPETRLETSKTTHMRLFPDHCEKNAIATMILNLLLLPGVLIKLDHPTFAAISLSNWIAALISSNSYSTSGSFLRRPSARPLAPDKAQGCRAPRELELGLTGRRSRGSTRGCGAPPPRGPSSRANAVTRG